MSRPLSPQPTTSASRLSPSSPIVAPLRLCITGADGKMGRQLLEAVCSNDEVSLVSALVMDDSPWLGKKVGELLHNDCAVIFTASAGEAIAKAEALIDFTRPEGTLAFLPHCVAHCTAMVIGTTGLSAHQLSTLQESARHIPMVVATNMSPGVNVFLHLVRKAAQSLPRFEAEVMEVHHHHKADSPSGTAISLGEEILIGRGVIAATANPSEKKQALEKIADFARYGITGARESQRIGFSAIRGGDVVGEHTVFLFGEGERIELRHVSSHRSHYAAGAIAAAQFVSKQAPGVYSMRDVLALAD